MVWGQYVIKFARTATVLITFIITIFIITIFIITTFGAQTPSPLLLNFRWVDRAKWTKLRVKKDAVCTEHNRYDCQGDANLGHY